MKGHLKKHEWVILLLHITPMDRIRLMKALFLIWHESNRAIPGFFQFRPYLYGPFSLELYTTLTELQNSGDIVQLEEHSSANYYLTDKGKKNAAHLIKTIDPERYEQIQRQAKLVANVGFRELLENVYKVAPDFTSESVMNL